MSKSSLALRRGWTRRLPLPFRRTTRRTNRTSSNDVETGQTRPHRLFAKPDAALRALCSGAIGRGGGRVQKDRGPLGGGPLVLEPPKTCQGGFLPPVRDDVSLREARAGADQGQLDRGGANREGPSGGQGRAPGTTRICS